MMSKINSNFSFISWRPSVFRANFLHHLPVSFSLIVYCPQYCSTEINISFIFSYCFFKLWFNISEKKKILSIFLQKNMTDIEHEMLLRTFAEFYFKYFTFKRMIWLSLMKLKLFIHTFALTFRPILSRHEIRKFTWWFYFPLINKQ